MLTLLLMVVLSQDPPGTKFVETPDGGYTVHSSNGTLIGIVKKEPDGNFTVMTPDGRIIGQVGKTSHTLNQSQPDTPLNRGNSYQPPALMPNIPLSPPPKTGYTSRPPVSTNVPPRQYYYDDVYKTSVDKYGRTVYSNNRGQKVGSSTTDSRGNTYYSDQNGRYLGNSRSTPGGKTYYYNRDRLPLGK